MKVIIPFTFLKPGECLNCGSANLYILEKDINGIRVERDGELTDVTNLAHASKMICIQCNSEFEYERFGMYAKPLTESEYASKLEKKKPLTIETKNPFYKD